VLPSDELNEAAAPQPGRVSPAWRSARQRAGNRERIVFMLLEDEIGQVNLIVSPEIYERNRAIVRGEPLLLVRGRFERIKENRNIVVDTLESLGPLARRLSEQRRRRSATSSTPLRTSLRSAVGNAPSPPCPFRHPSGDCPATGPQRLVCGEESLLNCCEGTRPHWPPPCHGEDSCPSALHV
jgi:hypothetical protein